MIIQLHDQIIAKISQERTNERTLLVQERTVHLQNEKYKYFNFRECLVKR